MPTQPANQRHPRCCASILHACQCHVGAMPKLSQHPARYPCHQPGLCDWLCYQTIYDDTRNKLDGPTLSLSLSSFIRDWEMKPATNNKSSKQPRGQAKQSQRMQIALMHAWQGKKRNQRLSKTQHTLTINHEWAQSSVPHHLPVSPHSLKSKETEKTERKKKKKCVPQKLRRERKR